MKTKVKERENQEFWFVYILKCADGRIYTGYTFNIEQRLQYHQSGQIESTKYKLPVRIVTYIAFNNKYEALKFEKYLKSGSGRAFAKRHLY